MVPRRILSILVLALPVLIVAFAVVMGGYALAEATESPQSQSGARGLFWVAMVCLLLLVGDALLLLMALGMNSLAEPPRGRDEH